MKKRLLFTDFRQNINPMSDSDYLDCVKDLINNEVVLSMKNYRQHGNTTCFDHCLSVSYVNYQVCKKYKLNYLAAARAGLLHDFFLYDWHLQKNQLKHHFTHPKIALRNAKQYFSINDLESEIIKKHMWPLTIVPPLRKEAYVVVFVDKYCTCLEVAKYCFRHIKKVGAIPNKIVAIFRSISVAAFAIINDFF